MTDLQALLDVQRFDNELDQLRYRNEHLPERAQLEAVTAELAALAAATATTAASRDDLRRRQRQLEDEATDIEAKAVSLEGRLYDGSVTSPKEATAINDEIAGLKERQSILEDQAIELLMEIEPFDSQLETADSESERLAAARHELETAVATTEASISAEISSVEEQRGVAAGKVATEILEDYRKLRITYGPDAVVEFDAGRGGGCPVAMSAVELDRWKHLPVGSLEHCVDCGRLVAKLA